MVSHASSSPREVRDMCHVVVFRDTVGGKCGSVVALQGGGNVVVVALWVSLDERIEVRV